MNSVKFVHFSDLHLDSPFTSIGPPVERIVQRRQDLLEAFDAIIDLVIREKADLLLISGDLYEHCYVKKSTISYINKRFKEIEDIKVFIVPGNHDPYVNNSYYRNFEWSSNVYILNCERPIVELEDLGVCIYGLGFDDFSRGSKSDKFEPVSENMINILLVHGTVDMNFKKNAYNPFTSDELSRLNMDYIALGHFHNRIDNVGQKGVIYNPGSPEPLGFDEEGEHGVFIGSIYKEYYSKKLDIGYVNVNRKSYISLDVNIDALNSDEAVIERTRASLSDLTLENTLVSITLKGYAGDEYKPDNVKLMKQLENGVFYIDIKDETLPAYNFDELKKEPGLKGMFVRKLLDRVNSAGSEKEKYLLMKSLYYGVEALEKGRIEDF